MRWTYDLCGAEPIIKDCPVYDAAALENGEMLMKGATGTGTADGFTSLITAYSTTADNCGIDNVGILNELQYATGSDQVATPSSAFAATAGVRLGKVIINPFAVYRAEYDQGADYDVLCSGGSSTTNIADIIATADEAIGAYVYFTYTSGSTAALRGSLRQITDNTTAGATVATLPATPSSTTDMFIVINPAHNYTPGGLTADAKGLSSAGTTLTNAMSNATGTNYRIVESWMEANGIGFVALTGYKNRDTNLTIGNLDGLPSDTKFYSDIVSKDHLFGAQE